MKRKILILLFSFPLFALACCKECEEPKPPKPPKPLSSTKLSVVWHIPFHSDVVEFYFLDPILIQDYLILPSQFPPDGYTSGIGVFHKLTGKRHSAWQSEPGGTLDNNDDLEGCKLGGNQNNIIFIANYKSLYAFDVNTKQRLWKSTRPLEYHFESNFSILGGNPFVTCNLGDEKSKLIRFNAQTGRSEDIVQLYPESGYRISIRPPAWHIRNNGDTLLFFSASGWNFGLGRTKIRVYCYNLTRREMVWEKTDFSTDNNGAGYVAPIITDEQNVIFMGLSSIHCFNIANGELLWQHDLFQIESFSMTPPLYDEGKIYLRGQTGNVYCYDAITGTELWSNKSLKATPTPDGRMDICDGNLYFTGRRVGDIGLYCLSAQTGEFKWFDTGPGGRVAFGVIADRQLGYLYCTCGEFVTCIDLKKTPIQNK